MMRAEPWQKAEVPGPLKASVITKPEVVVAMVKKAKRLLLILGPEASQTGLGDRRLIDYAVLIAKAGKMGVVATAQTVGELLKRGFQGAVWMSAMDIANRLRDPEWKGLDGSGQYDLALVAGIHYYVEWVMLSALKHFAPSLKTVSLDRFYQPHAAWSFPNLKVEEWLKQLDLVVSGLEKTGA